MDGYYDNLGMNQYSPNMTPNFEGNSTKNIVRSHPTDHAGYYEDSLRFGQYGVPSRLNCREPNPYIQDDIRKSQRHNPIRLFNVKDRADLIAKTTCEPGLVGTEYPINSDQKVIIVQAEGKKDCENCKQMIKESGKENFSVCDDISDSMTLFIVFIFLVLVFMCFYYWKSIGDIKETLAVMKELITQRG
jgi:hypothetical protein